MLMRERGMTLTETLLAVSVSMMMLVWIAKYQAQAMEDMRAKATADALQSVRTAAVQYFTSNRSALVAAMDTGAGAATWCTHNDTTKKLCVLDVPTLITKGVLPSGAKATTPYQQKIWVAYRLVDAATGRTEFLVYGGTNGGNEVAMSNESAALAAQMMGENGGMVPATNTGACSTTQACGTAGAWTVTLSAFVHASAPQTQGGAATYGLFL